MYQQPPSPLAVARERLSYYRELYGRLRSKAATDPRLAKALAPDIVELRDVVRRYCDEVTMLERFREDC